MTPTLKLKLQNGARFELPASAIKIVEESAEGKGSIIGYDLGAGAAHEVLNDNYGFVKKQVLDAGGITNPIEMTSVSGDGKTCRVTLSRERIVARLEVLNSPVGVHATLTIASGNSSFELNVADTLDQMDGIESRAPKSSRAKVIA
ncbi:hypothetical protein [uncultured Sphingobium sp.]|uniref:hypothetical protein n=1 Tax=uncultured Sphingobium sp. TaxID=316087 RepID=UPI000EEEFA0B|nr:hypothetical protein [Sphingobium sp.]|tara:strand:+ start:46029 stop:46466 length:438 start_codon:yes stop_codon:yes gene_type:complete